MGAERRLGAREVLTAYDPEHALVPYLLYALGPAK